MCKLFNQTANSLKSNIHSWEKGELKVALDKRVKLAS